MAEKKNLRDNIWQTTFNKDRTIDIKVMEPTYENDPEDEGYYDNKIVSTKKVGQLKYKVDDAGKIVKVSGDEGATAAND